MVLLAWGRSHRTTRRRRADPLGHRPRPRRGSRRAATSSRSRSSGPAPPGSAGRKRIRVNGLARRATGLAGLLRVVVFAPEEMLLIAGSPSLRRAVIDQLATTGSPAYADALATYGRTLQQRNSLLRAIREEGASRDELRFWDGAFIDSGAAIVTERRRLLEVLAEPARRGPRGDRPGRGGGRPADPRATRRTRRPRPGSRRGTRSPAGWPRRPTRRSGTARRWSGRTATTSSSSWPAATWRASPRAASSGRRSSPSSWPSSTC